MAQAKRHPLHSICPYFAMFPESFVEQQLIKFSSPGDLVFDPFCGRGTTVLESLLKGRRAAGSDINPVAFCVASAKATTPTLDSVISRITKLEKLFQEKPPSSAAPTPFFECCFERQTLSEILFLREALVWRKWSVDRFIAAVMLGILHGESHRSPYVLSNRMPRTISTKPRYSINWWSAHNLTPPRRPVFDILRKATMFRYRVPPAEIRGSVKLTDARLVARAFPKLLNQVRLVITSPPYIDTTDAFEDQWLRLWFLGGAPHPQAGKNPDDRHKRPEKYWAFLHEAWKGLGHLLADDSFIVIRVGGSKMDKGELLSGVTGGLTKALPDYKIKPLDDGVTSSIHLREVSAFRPKLSRKANVEHDFTYNLLKCRRAVRFCEA